MVRLPYPLDERERASFRFRVPFEKLRFASSLPRGRVKGLSSKRENGKLQAEARKPELVCFSSKTKKAEGIAAFLRALPALF